MFRVAKPEGIGNILLEDVPMPAVGPQDVLVRNQVSLISRGSEILRRYMHSEAIDPAIMGYSVPRRGGRGCGGRGPLHPR
ncbi:MAG: hypothetical protein R2856_30295 [Caldilineaceae bacterium]